MYVRLARTKPSPRRRAPRHSCRCHCHRDRAGSTRALGYSSPRAAPRGCGEAPRRPRWPTETITTRSTTSDYGAARCGTLVYRMPHVAYKYYTLYHTHPPQPVQAFSHFTCTVLALLCMTPWTCLHFYPSMARHRCDVSS